MIKFFKHIRRSLIQKNQMGKYFKYAVGEIILVVIGILIALQINNWNENIKKQKLKENYISSLLDDLKQDTAMVSTQYRFYKKDTTVLKKQINRIVTHNNLDTLKKIARYEFDTNIQIITAFNNKTYNTLINTGNIDLFEPWLVEELSRLDNMQKLMVNVYQLSLNSYSDNLLIYRENFSFFDDAFAGNSLDLLWEEIEYKELMLRFNQIMTSKLTTDNNVIQFHQPFLEVTSDLIKRIKKAYSVK